MNNSINPSPGADPCVPLPELLRNCISGRGAFSYRKQGGCYIFFEGSEAEGVLQELLPDPRRLLDAGEIYKPGSRGYAVKVDIRGKAYFLKCYEARGVWYRIRNAFRMSRALASWRANWGLYALGLPVPRPLVCLESRRLKLLGTAYLLTDFFSGTSNLWEAWEVAGPSQRTRLLTDAAAVLGRMHGSGAIHGDLKWYNILVGQREAGPEIYLVDLDGSSLHSRASLARSHKDLERFLRDLRQVDQQGQLESLFMVNWRKAYDLSSLPGTPQNGVGC